RTRALAQGTGVAAQPVVAAGTAVLPPARAAFAGASRPVRDERGALSGSDAGVLRGAGAPARPLLPRRVERSASASGWGLSDRGPHRLRGIACARRVGPTRRPRLPGAGIA